MSSPSHRNDPVGTRRRGVRSCAVVTALAVTVLLQGCAGAWTSMVGWLPFVGPDPLKTVTLTALGDVNGGYPVAVDVVFIRDPDLVTKLAVLRAGEWFSGRADFARRYPKQLTVKSWEVVPAQRLVRIPVKAESKGSVAAVVFADYPGEGTYRVDVRETKEVEVVLKQKDFEVISE